MQTPVLSMRNLRTYFHLDEGVLKAVDGVSLDLLPGPDARHHRRERLRQERGRALRVASGLSARAYRAGLSRSSERRRRAIRWTSSSCIPTAKQLRRIRGRHVAMIFQEPMTSLSPVHTVGFQITEAVLLHVTDDRSEARAIDGRVDWRGWAFPTPTGPTTCTRFELSGGLRQRVMIAMALSCSPSVLIADEPTTALDVTIQWQILRLMAELRDDFGMSILYITHDFGVLAQIADRVAVMYLGRIVETGDVITLFQHPLHPYTQGLLKSIPWLASHSRARLNAISGHRARANQPSATLPVCRSLRVRYAQVPGD